MGRGNGGGTGNLFISWSVHIYPSKSGDLNGIAY